MPRLNTISGWTPKRFVAQMDRIGLSAQSLAILCNENESIIMNMMAGECEVEPRVVALLRLFCSAPKKAREELARQLQISADPQEWRGVPGYPAYEASSGGIIRRDGRHLQQTQARSGHLRVTLYNGLRTRGKSRGWRVQVHRVIALTFLGPPPSAGSIIRHINGHAFDNRADNLCWGTTAENLSDRLLHQKNGKPKPVENPWTTKLPRRPNERSKGVSNG